MSLWFDDSQDNWPISLPRDPCTDDVADCVEARDLRVTDETIAGKQIHVETGFVSGGFGLPRWERVMSWKPNELWRASVSVDTYNDATLDTLEALVHTIHIGQRDSLR